VTWSLTRRQRAALLFLSAGAYAAWLAGLADSRAAHAPHFAVSPAATR